MKAHQPIGVAVIFAIFCGTSPTFAWDGCSDSGGVWNHGGSCGHPDYDSDSGGGGSSGGATVMDNPERVGVLHSLLVWPIMAPVGLLLFPLTLVTFNDHGSDMIANYVVFASPPAAIARAISHAIPKSTATVRSLGGANFFNNNPSQGRATAEFTTRPAPVPGNDVNPEHQVNGANITSEQARIEPTDEGKSQMSSWGFDTPSVPAGGLSAPPVRVDGAPVIPSEVLNRLSIEHPELRQWQADEAEARAAYKRNVDDLSRLNQNPGENQMKIFAVKAEQGELDQRIAVDESAPEQ